MSLLCPIMHHWKCQHIAFPLPQATPAGWWHNLSICSLCKPPNPESTSLSAHRPATPDSQATSFLRYHSWLCLDAEGSLRLVFKKKTSIIRFLQPTTVLLFSLSHVLHSSPTLLFPSSGAQRSRSSPHTLPHTNPAQRRRSSLIKWLRTWHSIDGGKVPLLKNLTLYWCESKICAKYKIEDIKERASDSSLGSWTAGQHSYGKQHLNLLLRKEERTSRLAVRKEHSGGFYCYSSLQWPRFSGKFCLCVGLKI